MSASQPIMGPAALAWKIANYPKIWIPFLCIVVGVIVLLYFLITGTVGKDPMPAIEDVKEMYIAWGAAPAENSFKKIPHERFYPSLFQCTRQGYPSTRETGPATFATVRVVAKDGTTTTITFHEEDLIRINGQCYDHTMPPLFLQDVEQTRNDTGY
jgi:hypothetical protein